MYGIIKINKPTYDEKKEKGGILMTPEEWQAIKKRDTAYDGKFLYGVTTTKVICRPSCATRHAVPSHIVIFYDLPSALQAGYRPCCCCRPDCPEWKGAKKELAEKAKKYIHLHYTEKFSLRAISAALFVNCNYLVRIFHEITNDTLLSYHHRLRCQEAKRLLLQDEYSIAYISTAVGYCSPSHFARIFKKYVHQTPSAYRMRQQQSKRK